MSQRSTEIRVGVAVVVAILILILGVMWIEKVSFSSKFVSYTAYFDDVGGLGSGDPLTVSGVRSGEVGSVVLEPGLVKIELLISESVTLFDDCRVQIMTIGLMGEKYVGIYPGATGNVLPPGSVIQGEYRAGMAEAVAGFGDMIEELNETMRMFRALVEMEGEGASVVETIRKVDELAGEILVILRENRADIRSAAQNIEDLSGNVNDLVGSNKEALARGIDDFAAAAARFDSLTVSLKSITEKIENGEGTLGMLVNEKTLHEDIEQMLASLNALLADVKADPHKYFKIELF
jgi:phospholipid/cholesterol/gamma-HCH transport system substrate-binding protein